MALFISISTVSIIGIIYGIIKKSKPVTILSIAVLAVTVAVWVYFYNNPY